MRDKTFSKVFPHAIHKAYHDTPGLIGTPLIQKVNFQKVALLTIASI